MTQQDPNAVQLDPVQVRDALVNLDQMIGSLLGDQNLAGMADPRWFAIARTELQKGMLCLQHAFSSVHQQAAQADALAAQQAAQAPAKPARKTRTRS